MNTIKDYLKYYKDLTFEEYPFNDLDNILFSEIPYLPLSTVIENKISLEEACELLLKKYDKKKIEQGDIFLKEILNNFIEMSNSNRYKHIRLANAVDYLDSEKQFGAITIYFKPREVYISFKGTDNSVIGWKENFEISYQFPTKSQEYAINYLNEALTFFDKKVYVGGHSKGGNLAMTASIYCNDKLKKKIVSIFNNDGPGFKNEQIKDERFQKMSSKIINFLPEDSVVGVLLENPTEKQIVKSTAKNILQHDLNTWECFGSYLLSGKQTLKSKTFAKKVLNIQTKLSDKEKEDAVTSIFGILEKNNIKNIKELKSLDWTRIFRIIKDLKNIKTETKNMYIEMFKAFFFKEEKQLQK